MNIRTSYIKYISGLILFGLNGIISSHIHLASYDIVFFRTLLGSLFFILLCTMRGIKIHDKEDSPQQFMFAVLSGVSLGLSWIFLYEAYQRIGVGLSSISYYCGPVIVMLMSPIIFRERLGFAQIISFIIVFAGMLLVSLPGLTGSSSVDKYGLFCGFASAIVHALMVIFTMKAPDISGVRNSALQVIVSFLTISAYILISGRRVLLPSDGTQWFFMLFLGIINTGIGCYLYFSDIAKLPVAAVSMLGYLEPLSSVIFAVILLHETMTPAELIGAVLILSASAASELLPKKASLLKQNIALQKSL